MPAIDCPFYKPAPGHRERMARAGLNTTVVSYGKMPGAHGQPGALLWAQMEDGAVIFNDTARCIHGICIARLDLPGSSRIRHCYIRGYDYADDRRAAELGR